MGNISQVNKYVQACLPIMGLAHWRVRVKFDRSDRDNLAHISITPGLFDATLCITSAFRALPSGLKRETIAHELIHIYTSRQLDRAIALIRPAFPDAVWPSIYAALDTDHEETTEALSRVIAPRLPRYPLG